MLNLEEEIKKYQMHCFEKDFLRKSIAVVQWQFVCHLFRVFADGEW